MVFYGKLISFFSIFYYCILSNTRYKYEMSAMTDMRAIHQRMMSLNVAMFYYDDEALQRGKAVRNHILAMKELTWEKDSVVEMEECPFTDYTYIIEYKTADNDEMFLAMSCGSGFFTFAKNDKIVFKIKLYEDDE